MINKNNVNINYSCTNNISKIIDYHNKKLINKLNCFNKDNLKHACNCKKQNEFPLENKYNLDNIVYQANIPAREIDTIDKACIGMTSFN